MVDDISIIVPVLNEVERLPKLVESLQSAGAKQIIIVDGGSTDGSLEAIRKITLECPSITTTKLLRSASGRAKQMNTGAALASKSMLLFLHVDTELPENALSEIQQAEHWGRFDVRFDQNSWQMRMIAFFMNMRSRLTAIATGDQAIFVRRELFESVGGFADIPLMEDIALSKALKRRHTPYCSHICVTTSARRWQENGVLRTVLSMWWFRLAYFLGVPAEVLKRHYDDIR